MAIHNLSAWQHDHAFDAGNRAAEQRTWIVVGITAITMVVEIVGGKAAQRINRQRRRTRELGKAMPPERLCAGM